MLNASEGEARVDVTWRPAPSLERIEDALASYRGPIMEELGRLLPADARMRAVLYDPIREHALRPGKGLRPAICLATCRALGGGIEACLPTAAVLEMLHNAFLIHDDVEDGSLVRRDQPAMHVLYGAAAAINAGDAMLALALRPLLDNTALIGLGKALRVLETIADAVRHTVEGQALELDWIRHGAAAIDDRDYLTVVEKKTASYSFVAPTVSGAIIAGAPEACIAHLSRFAQSVGVAFQIRDDVLNLRAGERWGKERLDDLWEGKRTLVLAHALRQASFAERSRAERILRKPRPTVNDDAVVGSVDALERIAAAEPRVRDAIEAALAPLRKQVDAKRPDDVAFLRELIDRAGSLDHADSIAEVQADRALAALSDCAPWIPASPHASFLHDIIEFVRRRDH
jgi:geranylgeranyl diphosphate synthase, type II